MNYAECMNKLMEMGHELRSMKFDVAAIRRVLDALGRPERAYPSAIVAGTNGKGSTCAMLAAILDRAGYRTGLYTSPHLVRVNERICVAGHEISDSEFASVFTETWQAGQEVADRESPVRPLSFFELLTATAFLHFAREQVDFAVLEVGMGGRLDATNVTEPRVAVITNVDLDHEEFLGRTHAAIAREKAGIIKPGRPVISGCRHPAARQVIRDRANETGAELLELSDFANITHLDRGADGCFTFDLALNGHSFPSLTSGLAGKFQVANAVAAAAAAWTLRQEGMVISDEAIRRGLGQVRWPGRLQVIHHEPLVLLDGAHNPAAAREVADFIREQFPKRKLRLVYGSMRDKSIEEIASLLFPLAEEVYLTKTSVARAASPEEIIERAGRQAFRAFTDPDPAAALERAVQASSESDVVLAAGSLYLVGAIEQARRDGRLALESVPECLVSGHGFSRAAKEARLDRGFSPWDRSG
jgi:dihydrofolate synthase / folylpolyglutamate synthase